MADLGFVNAVELARSVRSRELSPVDIAMCMVERIQRLNPALNAYVYFDADGVIDQAKALETQLMNGAEVGPLFGVPYSIKELSDIEGLPSTGCGDPARRDVVAAETDVVASSMARAGGLFLGKTNSPQLGYYGVTDNPVFGASQNPWKPGYITGGSSGGAAAAVAAGLGPLAEGSDGAGSVRIPASCCGIFTLKPSLGRIPFASLGFNTNVHHGPLTRSVEDAALMLSVCEGFDAGDPLSLPDSGSNYLADIEQDMRGWRIGWSPDLGFATVDPQIRSICESSLKAFETGGAVVDDAELTYEDPEEAMWHGLWLALYAGLADSFTDPAAAEGLDPQLLELFDEARNLRATQIAAAQRFRTAMWEKTVNWFRRYDLLVCPTLCVEPFPNGQFCPDSLRTAPLRTQLLGWLLTYPFNMLSPLPVASVPCGVTVNGLPVGLQIVGKPHGDAAVLRAAANFERAAPWPLIPSVAATPRLGSVGSTP